MKDFTKKSVEDKKHHIGISNYSYNVLQEDYHRFNMSESNISWNAYLNLIITEYIDNQITPCNLNSMYDQLISGYQYIITEIHSSTEKELKRIENALKNTFLSEIAPKYVHTYPDKISKSFTLNDANISRLTELEGTIEAEIFKRPGKYTNEILESHARKPFIDRESIIYNDKIRMIQKAISKKKCLIFCHTNGEKYQVAPYKLAPDTLGNYLFLAAIVIPTEENTSGRTEPYPAAFHISRIYDIRIVAKTFYSINPSDKDTLEKLIIKNGIQHIVDETFFVQVQFTESGYQRYQNQLYRRPNLSKIISDTDRIYEFEGTYYQMSNYFFQFGKDAKILGPEEFQNYIIHEYQTALDNYL